MTVTSLTQNNLSLWQQFFKMSLFENGMELQIYIKTKKQKKKKKKKNIGHRLRALWRPKNPPCTHLSADYIVSLLWDHLPQSCYFEKSNTA